MTGILVFNRRRWKAFATLMGLIYFVAICGVSVAIYIPILGTPFFLVGLLLWYIPGVIFYWTGFFAYHEFGAGPTGWEGQVIMFLFYAIIAFIVSWPFGRVGKTSPSPPDS
jgi:hypothetical protein